MEVRVLSRAHDVTPEFKAEFWRLRVKPPNLAWPNLARGEALSHTNPVGFRVDGMLENQGARTLNNDQAPARLGGTKTQIFSKHLFQAIFQTDLGPESQ